LTSSLAEGRKGKGKESKLFPFFERKEVWGRKIDDRRSSWSL